jgi:serine/threonine-protein kinase RsbT
MSLARGAGRLGVVIEARDEGPGIADLTKVIEEGCSNATGLGFGLPGVKRLMDEFDIASEMGKGTRVTAKKWQVATERG